MGHHIMCVRFYSQTWYQKYLWGKKKSVKYTKIQVKDIIVGADFGPDFPPLGVHLHRAILIYQVWFKESAGLFVCINNLLHMILFSCHMLCACKHLLWF